MRTPQRMWKSIVAVLIVLVAIGVLFFWYSTTNKARIEDRNLNYALDSARQSAKHVESEFYNSQRRLRTHASLVSLATGGQDAGAPLLASMEENSAFDAFRFVNAQGITTAANGKTANSQDRSYFQHGIAGEAGLEVVFDSRMTGETMMTFYTPVTYDGEPYGVLLGLYFAKDYLQDMLETSYFGEEANVYLCTRDEMVIACSCGGHGDIFRETSLLDALLSDGVIDSGVAASAREVFRSGEGEGAFICDTKSTTDNLCVIWLPDSDYVLVQSFPQSVTTGMIDDANRIGVILQTCLISLFVLYVIFLLFQARHNRKHLEQENREMGYIIDGVTTLFTRFAMVDLEKDTYQYLGGTQPEAGVLPAAGPYWHLAQYLCDAISEEEERRAFAVTIERRAIIAALEHEDDMHFACHVLRSGKLEWEHVNIICLERTADGQAAKVLFTRQNITAGKEQELRAQARISLADRKERQYMTAIRSDAICTYEVNLTQDLLEHEVTCLLGGRQVDLLEQAGLSAPCRASQLFGIWERSTEKGDEDASAGIDVQRLLDRYALGEREVTEEYWCSYSEGQQMCVRQSFFMSPNDDGDVMALIIVKDITARVQKQREQTEALKEALMQAQHANNAKTTFLSNMSHDIRTPMNAIIGFTTLAMTHIDNQNQVRDCLQKVLSSSNHLLSLINDILDMSRIESGKLQFQEQECNISELTHNLVNIIQPQVKAKQLELFIDTFDVNNEDVITDALKLSQVFVNLLSNAVKYTPAGGTVSFRIQQDTTFHRGYGDYVFTVKDNGIGMTPEFVEHIFEPFEREASTTKTGIQGTGLGMAITKNIVEMMGGTITVQSEKGKGSEFRVELSLKLQDVEKTAMEIKELEGLRALVVDDDCDSCESVTKMLKQIGMRSEWTISGKEAVHRAKSAHNEGDSYHTYIIDWQMPEMSGIETTRRIRAAIGADAPIIILTAYDWTSIEEEAKEAGVTAFCAKPLFMSDLKSVLLAANHLVEKEETEASWTEMDFSGKRVLLVEDNELNREIAQSILEETGFAVETAPDGTDAVEMVSRAEEGYYDAILMDVQMPVMDGYEATRTIRALRRKDVRDIPIIAMTANAMEEDKEAALKNGMNAHIAKPLDIDLFLKVLGKYLG